MDGALEAAKARADEAEANMMKAAQYGQQILEKLKESERIRAEIEQEKYSLKLQLENKEASESALQDELNGK